MNYKTDSFEIQKGQLGRDFKLTIVHKGKGEKWVGRVLKHDWYYIYKYIDTGDLFALHENFEGKLIEKLNNEETLKLIHNDQTRPKS